jgi:hypothetical protein
MTHFAATGGDAPVHIGPRACVAVFVDPAPAKPIKPGHLVVRPDSFRVSAPGTWLRVNPEQWAVVSLDRKTGELSAIPKGKGVDYYVSAHTTDPNHLLTVITKI